MSGWMGQVLADPGVATPDAQEPGPGASCCNSNLPRAEPSECSICRLTPRRLLSPSTASLRGSLESVWNRVQSLQDFPPFPSPSLSHCGNFPPARPHTRCPQPGTQAAEPLRSAPLRSPGRQHLRPAGDKASRPRRRSGDPIMLQAPRMHAASWGAAGEAPGGPPILPCTQGSLSIAEPPGPPPRSLLGGAQSAPGCVTVGRGV